MKIRFGIAQAHQPRLPSKLPDFELTSKCHQDPETQWSHGRWCYYYRLSGTPQEVAMKILRSGREKILVEFEDQMLDWMLEVGYERILDEFRIETVE